MAKSGNYAGTIVEQIVRKLTKTQAFKDALENFNAQRNQPGTENPARQTPDPLDPQEDEDAEDTEDLASEDETDASRAADLYNRIFFSSNRDTVNFGRVYFSYIKCVKIDICIWFFNKPLASLVVKS